MDLEQTGQFGRSGQSINHPHSQTMAGGLSPNQRIYDLNDTATFGRSIGYDKRGPGSRSHSPRMPGGQPPPPPPDVPGASRKLGISPRVLREALGLPPKGRGPGAGRREGMPSPGATPMQPQPMATPVAPSPVPQPTPAATATSTPERTPAKSRVVTGKYLMSFSSCETATPGCQDPRNHEVYLAQSDDGVSWSLVPGWEVYPGSVPDVIRRGSTLYVYDRQYVTKYDLATDAQQVHWRGPGGADPAKQVTVEGLGQAGYVDPSLILDDQGRLVLFFMHGIIGADPAHCPPGEATCLKHFDSAPEVEGSDGKRFLFDEGHRLTIAVGGGDYRGACACRAAPRCASGKCRARSRASCKTRLTTISSSFGRKYSTRWRGDLMRGDVRPAL